MRIGSKWGGDVLTDLENIYQEYFQDVYLFILSLSCNKNIAEEITQETFFKALKKIDDFREECSIKVWLCQIAKNTYYTYLDNQKRISHENFEDRINDYTIENDLIDKESSLRIHKHLHHLNEPYKEVFMLRIFGELSFAQISQIFKKTESWARVTYYRAKQKIQTQIKEEEQ